MNLRELAVLGFVFALVSAPAVARAADAGPPGCYAAGVQCNTSGTDNNCCSGMCTLFGMCADVPSDAGCVPSGAACTARSNCCDLSEICLIDQKCGARPPPPEDPVESDDAGNGGASSSGSSGSSGASSGSSGTSGTSGASSGALTGGSSASGCACTTVPPASAPSLPERAGGVLSLLGLATIFARRRAIRRSARRTTT